jgi:hypothetical protein
MCLLTNEESLNEPSIQVAYNSLLPILPIHEKLLETLRERIQNWHPDQEVAGIFLKFVCARIIVRTHAVFSSLSLSLSLTDEYVLIHCNLRTGSVVPELLEICQ